MHCFSPLHSRSPRLAPCVSLLPPLGVVKVRKFKILPLGALIVTAVIYRRTTLDLFTHSTKYTN